MVCFDNIPHTDVFENVILQWLLKRTVRVLDFATLQNMTHILALSGKIVLSSNVRITRLARHTSRTSNSPNRFENN